MPSPGGTAKGGPIPVSSFEEALSPAQAKKFSVVNAFHSLLAVMAGNLEASFQSETDRQTESEPVFSGLHFRDLQGPAWPRLK